jgi:hypothetical protein
LGNSVRWTPEQLEEYRKRSTVSTHLIVSKKETAPRAAPKESKLEIRFVQQLADAGIAGYTRNYFPILDLRLYSKAPRMAGLYSKAPRRGCAAACRNPPRPRSMGIMEP